ncbi:MAG: CHASE4 domain-containing protein [Candidatus Aminicenantales bacterium]
MKVKQKTLLIISATIFILAAALYTGSRLILGYSSNKQEEIRLHNEVQYVLNFLTHELSNLDRLAADYASGNDAYALIQNPKNAHIQSKLVNETFITYNLSFVLFFNTQGDMVLGKGFDISRRTETPLPEGLSEFLSPDSRLLRHSHEQSSLAGFLVLPENPFLLVSRPILTSESTGPIQGILILGRALNSEFIKQISQITNLPIMIYEIDSQQVPQEVKTDLLSSAAPSSISVKILDKDWISGFALIMDIDRKSAFIMEIKQPRMFHRQFVKGMNHFLLSVILIGLVSTLVIQFLMNKLVTSRLARLHGFVKGIEARENSGERLYIHGDDEISKLTTATNNMVEALQRQIEKIKPAEETIKKSEAQYRALYSMVRLMCDNVPDLIWAKDMEKKYLFTNKAICENLLHARDTEEPIGKTEAFFAEREKRAHPEDAQYHTFGDLCIDSDSAVIKSQRPERFDEFGNVRGEFLYLDVYKAPFRDEHGQMIGTVGCARDITKEKIVEKERLVAQKRLEKSEIKYHALFEASTDAILLETLDGRILDCNKAACDLFGYAKEEMLKLTMSDLTSEEWKNRISDVSNAVRTKGGIFIESLNQKKNGEIFPADISIRLAKVGEELLEVTYIRNIAERKRAEKLKTAIYNISEAASSALTLNELFQLIHSIIQELIPTKNFYISLYDPKNNTLSFPYYIDEYDETPTPKKLGKGLTEYVLRHGEPLLASPEKFEALEKKGEVESIGTPSIDWLGVPLKTEDRTIGVMVIQSYHEGIRFGEEDKNILMFVSSQVAMAIERKRAEEQLKTSLQEKEVLLREIHHRVKNNMQVISSLFNLQVSQVKDEKAVGIFKECQGRIRTMALVHEKLYQSKDLSHINFSDYIESLTIHLFHFWHVKPDQIKLNLDLSEIFLDIHTAVPCGLIINELVSNALEHAFPRGESGELTIKLHPFQDHRYELIVRDTGVGLPKEVDPFKSETLGIQLVMLLVKQLDGSLEFSRDGGTLFRIIFHELKYKQRI